VLGFWNPVPVTFGKSASPSFAVYPSLPISELDQRLDRLRTIDTVDWSTAQQREAIIRNAMNGDGPTTPLVDAAPKALGLSARTVRRLIVRYKTSAQTTSLVAHQRGPKKSHRRLGTGRERLIDAAIEKRYLVRPRTPTVRPTIWVKSRPISIRACALEVVSILGWRFESRSCGPSYLISDADVGYGRLKFINAS
jgi:hypothetical protein